MSEALIAEAVALFRAYAHGVWVERRETGRAYPGEVLGMVSSDTNQFSRALTDAVRAHDAERTATQTGTQDENILTPNSPVWRWESPM